VVSMGIWPSSWPSWSASSSSWPSSPAAKLWPAAKPFQEKAGPWAELDEPDELDELGGLGKVGELEPELGSGASTRHTKLARWSLLLSVMVMLLEVTGRGSFGWPK